MRMVKRYKYVSAIAVSALIGSANAQFPNTGATRAPSSPGIQDANASLASEKVKEEIAAACRNTVEAAKKLLIPSLAAYPDLQSKANLVLVSPAADYNAFANYERRQVIIPVMWCLQTWYYVDALGQVNIDPSLRPRVVSYVKFLNERQDSAYRKGGFDYQPLPGFNEWANVPRQSLSTDQQEKWIAARDGMLVEAMAFVLGHEIGHLALNHKHYSQIMANDSRAQERAADAFAVSLLRKADISLIPAYATLQRFMRDEAMMKGIDASARTHPRAECRINDVVIASGDVDRLMSIPAARRDFESASGYTVHQFRKEMEVLTKDCNKNP